MNHGFPKEARLRRAREFLKVYRSGERVNVYPLRVRALRRDEGGEPQQNSGPQEDARSARLGLAVGTRVGPATVRNRWKRAIREAFRLHRHRLPGAYDMVIAVEWDSSPGDVARVPAAFLAVAEALREGRGRLSRREEGGG